MERSTGTISTIKTLGYPDSVCVRECRCDELPCPLVTWLVKELRAICPELKDMKDKVVLVGELRDLLADLVCPLCLLTSDLLEPALLYTITEFLVSELQAAHVLRYKELHPGEETTGGESAREQRVEDHDAEDAESGRRQHGVDEVADESSRRAETREELTLLLDALHLESSSQFIQLSNEVESRLALLPCGDMMDPLLNTSLNSLQWRQIEKINQALLKDYDCRRQMMMKRFQVTLQSFAWGEKEKVHSEVLAAVPPLASLSLSSQVSLPLLLAAREDQSCILPIKAGPSTAVYKVLMGSVPDRGGRPGEIEAPMPCWEARREKGGRGGRGGRGGGGRQQRQKFSGKKKREKDE